MKNLSSVMHALLYSFVLCRLIAGGLMVFSAVTRVSSFEADDDNDINDLVSARPYRCS